MAKSKITKPMRAGKSPLDLNDLRFPIMASPKLDGIRALMVDGKALTRTFKPIPNDFVREWMEANLPDGLDGELMPRDPSIPFKEFSGSVRRKTGEPDFVFMVFDHVTEPNEPFKDRYGRLKRLVKKMNRVGPGGQLMPTQLSRLQVVPHYVFALSEGLMSFHNINLEEGREGTMLRDPEGRYKCGTSTTKEGLLMKLKNFEDEEARVLEVVELMHNDNEAEKDAFGRTKRSSHAENKTPAGTMGSLRCEFVRDGTEFSVGTGFTSEDRDWWWQRRLTVVSAATEIKVKHQPDPGGRKDGVSPRFPVFIAIRDPRTDI